MPDINVVGIISKPGVSAAAMLVPELMEWLEGRGLRLRYDPPTGAYAGRNDAIPREQVPAGSDLVIVLGGDGTLLSAAAPSAAPRSRCSPSTSAAGLF
jgi:NAD+ kinase